MAAGFSLVRDNTYLSSIFLIWSWATLAYTGINVAEIVLAKSQDQGYGTGSLGFGIFVAASALGAVVGTVLAKGFIERLGVYGGYRAVVPDHRRRGGDLRPQPGPRDRLCRRRSSTAWATASGSSATSR